jgi:Mn-dependent DtxR family transcriptional regulator
MPEEYYGTSAPPQLTKNEKEIYEFITDEYQPAAEFSQYTPHISKPSLSNALTRLRQRGLIEGKKHSQFRWKGKEMRNVALWRRKQEGRQEDE